MFIGYEKKSGLPVYNNLCATVNVISSFLYKTMIGSSARFF